MGRDGVAAWVAAYERAWRSAGTEALTELFTTDATYQQGPFRLAALVGLVLRLPARFFAANLGCNLLCELAGRFHIDISAQANRDHEGPGCKSWI